MSANLDIKQEIISSIYSEKFIFDKKEYRTPKVNEAVSFILNTAKDCNKKEIGLSSKKTEKSYRVPRTGIEPALPFENKILSLARLPIPPSGQGMAKV